MKVYLISQDVNKGYETYDSAVVIAESEDMAKAIHPAGYSVLGIREEILWSLQDDEIDEALDYKWCSEWAMPKDVKVLELGEAYRWWKTPMVICSSYHAG